MNDNKYDIDLVDILNVLWKKKWFIIISTLIAAILVGIYSFLQPKVWEVETLILPSKILIQATDGKIEEFIYNDPKQVAEQINRGTYHSLIARDLGLDINKLPKIRAESTRDMNLIRISLKEKDVERAKKILHSLFNHLKPELDLKGESEKRTTEKTIDSLGQQIDIVKKRISEIEKELNTTLKRIGELESEQRASLKKQGRSETDSLAMLLYSNEIQKSLIFYDKLKESLSLKRIQKEDLSLEMEKRKEKINQIDSAKMVKEPTASLNPVSPKTKLNVLISVIVSLLISTMLALFSENIQRLKNTLSKPSQ